MSMHYVIIAREFGETAKQPKFIRRFNVVNDMVRFGPLRKYENRPIMESVNEMVGKLQNSEAYHHIIVKRWRDGAKIDEQEIILDWRMDAETMNRRMAEYAKYISERAELDRKAKELLAQIRKLDKGWGFDKNWG